MKQQYVLLRKENDLLNSLIGQSFNQRTKFEAYKILKEIHKQADQYSMEKALCYIVDKGEIKGVGGSSLMKNKKTGEIVSDLILDQFGIFLAGIMRRNVASIKSIIIKDRVGVNQTFDLYDLQGTSFFNRTDSGGKGFEVQVGSGSTAPARTDFKIQTAFGTAPENLSFNAVSDPIYNSGLGNFKYIASITSGGAGTINESIFLSQWQNSVLVQKTIAMYRDIISPAQSFIAGQSIALEYTTQL